MQFESMLDELQPEYQREDFGTMVRGKYAERMKQGCNVIVLEKSDSSGHSASCSLEIHVVEQPKRSVLDIIAEAPGQRLFQSSQEVEHYLVEERNSWDS